MKSIVVLDRSENSFSTAVDTEREKVDEKYSMGVDGSGDDASSGIEEQADGDEWRLKIGQNVP